LAALIAGKPLPLGRFQPDPWPTSTSYSDLEFI
jgi:hypothetical protein